MKDSIQKGTRLVAGDQKVMVVERLGDLVWVRNVFPPSEEHPGVEAFGPVQGADDLEDLIVFGWTISE